MFFITGLYLNRSKAKILTEFHTFVFCFAVQFLEMQTLHKAKQVEFWKDFRESEFTPSPSPGKASASFRARSHVYPTLSLLLTSHSPFDDLQSGFDFHHSWWTVSKLCLSVSPKTSALSDQRAHFCPHASFCNITFFFLCPPTSPEYLLSL